MNGNGFWPPVALVASLGVANGGCMLVPDIQDRVVELAVGGATVVEFVSEGTVNDFDETDTVNVLEGLDLGRILADAGIDATDVTGIALAGVEYRITVPDPQATRQIVNGTLTTTRNGGPEFPLLSGFTAAAGAVTGWQPAPLDPGGDAVADLNAMLDDIRAALPGSPPPNLTTVRYHLTGQSLPAEIPTRFTWELKVKVTIAGTVRVRVPA